MDAEAAQPGSALPVFGFVSVHRQPIIDGVAAEAAWLARAAEGGPAAAHLWTAPEGLVVPRRHAMRAGWAALDQRGLQQRASGGGLVPQGPGIWNLSLVWRAAASPALHAVYAELCANLCQAFARLGLQAAPGEVAGSFCDGRWNLAVGGRKFVGTAQAHKRLHGQTLVLAHAVIVVDAQAQQLCARCNAFEQALGSAERYRPEVLTSIAAELPGVADIESRTLGVLAEQFARVLVQPVR